MVLRGPSTTRLAEGGWTVVGGCISKDFCPCRRVGDWDSVGDCRRKDFCPCRSVGDWDSVRDYTREDFCNYRNWDWGLGHWAFQTVMSILMNDMLPTEHWLSPWLANRGYNSPPWVSVLREHCRRQGHRAVSILHISGPLLY